MNQRNILIDDSGRALLGDFGLVRIFMDEGSSGMTTTAYHTGTQRYLAYELVTAGEEAIPTTASDIYAVGCVGLEASITLLLRERSPFLTVTLVYFLSNASPQSDQQRWWRNTFRHKSRSASCAILFRYFPRLTAHLDVFGGLLGFGPC
jgi:serine/threonine protein kinase